MKRQEILTILSKDRENLRRRFGVSTVRLFGSVARDEAGTHSDIDLLVDFDETPSLFEFLRLRSYLEELVQCKVDLITESGLKERARSSVERDAIYVT